MKQGSLPFEIKCISEQDFKANKLKQQLSSEAVMDFKKDLEDIFKELNILVQFHDKVELSIFNKETDLIEDVFICSFEKKEIKVGKDAYNDIVIRERYISREHAIFRLEDKNVFLTDKGSTNGTYINGVRINPDEPQKLNSQDILHFGAQKIRFSINKEISEGIDLNASYYIHFVKGSSIASSKLKIPFFICRSMKQNKTVLCEFDRYFFYDIINSLLGFGKTGDFVYEKPVTKIEEGLFLYFFILMLESINKNLVGEDDVLVFDRISYLDDTTPALGDDYIMLALSTNINMKKYGIRVFVEGDSFVITEKNNQATKPYLLDLFSLKPIDLNVIAGETNLSSEEISSLNKESILIIEKWYLKNMSPQEDDNIVVEQYDTGIFLKGRISDTQDSVKVNVCIEQFFKKESLNMEDFENEKNKIISSLDTAIYVVIASKKITLAELSKLRKGDMMDFECDINSKVSLIVNNAVIAKGQLTEYEGKIGVEITDVMY